MPFNGLVPQTFPHHATGATLVSIGSTLGDGGTSGQDASMLDLGYCEDRVQIDERPQWEDIKNDLFGGMAGVPSEVQFLGATVYVHCNLNRFDLIALQRLSSIHPAWSALNIFGRGVVGTGAMGVFMRQGNDFNSSYMETLQLSSAREVITFYKAFVRQGKRYNMSTRHQQIALVFECHINSPCDMALYTIADGVNPCT